MYRLEQVFEGQQGQPLGLEFGVGSPDEIGRVLLEAEKAEALNQFHTGAGLGLGRGAALAHLLLIADDLEGFLAANAEVNRDIQPAGVDPPHIDQDIKLDLGQFLLELGYGLLGVADLVLVIGVVFETISIGDGDWNGRASGCFAHGRPLCSCDQEDRLILLGFTCGF